MKLVEERGLVLPLGCPRCGCYQRPHAWDGVLYDWCPACDRDEPVPVRGLRASAETTFAPFLKAFAAAAVVVLVGCGEAPVAPVGVATALRQCAVSDTVEVGDTGVRAVVTFWYSGKMCERLGL